MNNTNSKYQLNISDSINGLVITYQRPISWWLTAYSFIISAALFMFLTWAIAQVMTFFTAGADTSTWIIMLIVIPVFLFTMLNQISTGLDALLTVEKIHIDDKSVQLEKSGFQSLERNRAIPTDGKASFFLGRGIGRSLAVIKSKFLAQLYGTGILHSGNIDPMRCFLRGISQTDAIEVLEKIKAKYPQYNIFYQNTPNMFGGIGQS
jgi:hypothetical protein